MDAADITSSPSKAPSLLPAFEPLSSSPGGLPRQSKRKYDEHIRCDRNYYPTPIPTSSTGILPSSPNKGSTRPAFARTVSSLTERVPLGAVPSLEVPFNGLPVLMGRSSQSSDYQFAANRLISRVHVRAMYSSSTHDCPDGKITVECLGWNGCKIHLVGEMVELAKGEKYESAKMDSQIIVDVQDTRVMLLWPQRSTSAVPMSSSRAGSESPTKRRALENAVLPSSPPSLEPKVRSPASLPPVDLIGPTSFAATLIASQSSFDDEDDDAVKVYEDNESVAEFVRDATPTPAGKPSPRTSVGVLADRESSQSSALSETEEVSDHDEENDPVVHSFGPYGNDILAKFASFKSEDSPKPEQDALPGSPLDSEIKTEHPIFMPFLRTFQESPIKNHVINQLAFSRVHSLPLTTILANVPAEMKTPTTEEGESLKGTATPRAMTQPELKAVLEKVPCIGQISREGKDAAGKRLDDQYYYLPELDDDEMRRNTVSVARPPLRNVRKQHKQYYWKKPRC